MGLMAGSARRAGVGGDGMRIVVAAADPNRTRSMRPPCESTPRRPSSALFAAENARSRPSTLAARARHLSQSDNHCESLLYFADASLPTRWHLGPSAAGKEKKYDLLFQFFSLVQPVLARSLLCPPKHKLDVDRLLASKSWTICRPTSHEEAKGSKSPDTRKSECESQLLGICQKGKQASARYQPSVSNGGARGHLAHVAKREWASVGARQAASHSARLEPMKRTCRGQRSTVDGQGKASGYEPGNGFKTGTSSPRQCQVGASASAGGTGNFGVSFFFGFRHRAATVPTNRDGRMRTEKSRWGRTPIPLARPKKIKLHRSRLAP
ncbi:hypothetical protein L1887_49672 [Cichorium endivia]|nr:hypothetical protein L1887_49672 [Cichorium endivia]